MIYYFCRNVKRTIVYCACLLSNLSTWGKYWLIEVIGLNTITMGKIKQEPVEVEENTDVSIKTEPQTYDEKVEHCSVIAKPMAPKKLSKKIYKLIKKSSSHKNYIRNGLKIVQKQLRLGEKGIVVFAGDISPIEIMCHLPAVCEEKDVPYCYTPSRKDIGSAMGTMRGCIMVLIKEHEDYKDLFDEIRGEIKLLGHPL